jgi:hypothetical protein
LEKRFMLHMNTPNDLRQAAVQSWQWRTKRDVAGMVHNGYVFSARTTYRRHFKVGWKEWLGFMPLTDCAKLLPRTPQELAAQDMPDVPSVCATAHTQAA